MFLDEVPSAEQVKISSFLYFLIFTKQMKNCSISYDFDFFDSERILDDFDFHSASAELENMLNSLLY